MWPAVFQRLARGGLWSGTVATVTVKSRPAARDELEENPNQMKAVSDKRAGKVNGEAASAAWGPAH